MKTLKQIADELQVSKDKVKYRARGIPQEEKTMVDGVTYISEYGETLIKQAIQGTRIVTPGNQVSTSELLPILERIARNQEELLRRLEQVENTQQLPKPGFFSRLLKKD